jgi:ferritin
MTASAPRSLRKNFAGEGAAAVKEQDYPAQIMLQWFVTEQVEEEKNATQVVEQLKAVGESKAPLMLLDRHLGKRGE